MREIRGRDIAMIFQEPMTSLNPVLTIGFQIMEPLLIHLGMTEAAARARATELLKMVGIPDAERRLDQYPHQFSGGMRQRVMIAIALSCNPKLIIADEPTTALDVTIQAQILKLMKDLSRDLGIALVAHHAQPRHRRALRRPRERDVRRAAGGAGHARATCSRSRCIPIPPGCCAPCRASTGRAARKLETIEGLPPNLLEPPPGCRFAPRCPARLRRVRRRAAAARRGRAAPLFGVHPRAGDGAGRTRRARAAAARVAAAAGDEERSTGRSRS